MNEFFRSHVKMFGDEGDFLKSHESDIDTVPGLKDFVFLLNDKVQFIRTGVQFLETSSVGYTEAKNISRSVTESMFEPIHNMVVAYATVTKDVVLLNRVKLDKTQLGRIYDSELTSTLKSITAICQSLLTKLTPYGLTEAMLLAFDVQCKDFDAKLMGRPVLVAEQNAMKQRVDEAYAEANDLVCKNIDSLMELLKPSKPELYAEYQRLRRIEKVPYRKLELKISTFENLTEIPVPSASITIEEVEDEALAGKYGGAALVKHVKRTSTNGACTDKHLPEGRYRITAYKNGYEPITRLVYITPGETTRMRFDMQHKN